MTSNETIALLSTDELKAGMWGALDNAMRDLVVEPYSEPGSLAIDQMLAKVACDVYQGDDEGVHMRAWGDPEICESLQVNIGRRRAEMSAELPQRSRSTFRKLLPTFAGFTYRSSVVREGGADEVRHHERLIVGGKPLDTARYILVHLSIPSEMDLEVNGLVGEMAITGHLDGTLTIGSSTGVVHADSVNRLQFADTFGARNHRVMKVSEQVSTANGEPLTDIFAPTYERDDTGQLVLTDD